LLPEQFGVGDIEQLPLQPSLLVHQGLERPQGGLHQGHRHIPKQAADQPDANRQRVIRGPGLAAGSRVKKD
jgi:hypothetical protein